jgi:hypothetical protein
MDELNDPMSQKVLGAYYTPDCYVKLSTKLLLDAVSKVKTKDYVIIDRCAGTGNLEKFLDDETLSHCILNTYEGNEWIVLKELYDGKVRAIIPPKYLKEEGKITLQGGDALDTNVFKECKKYINNPNCTIILYENPPYAGETAATHNDTKEKIKIKSSKIRNEFIRKFPKASRDLLNYFVYSGFKYYKPSYYVLFGPIRY